MVSIDFSLIIVILNFILMLVILNKILYKPIKKFLTERQVSINDDIENAKISRKEAEELVKKQEEEYKKHTLEIRKLFDEKAKEAEKKAEEIVNQALKEKENKISELKQQLETEKNKAIKEIKGSLGEMISELAGKFLSGKIDEKQDEELIDDLIKQRGD